MGAIVPTVVVASYIAQTHLTYALVAAPLCAAAVLGFVCNRRPFADPALDGTASRRPVAIAAIVVVACWGQPLWDQVFDSGNLERVLSAGDAEGSGAGIGSRIITDVLALPPSWLGASLEDFDPGRRLVSGSTAAGGVVALLVVTLAASGAALVRPASRALRTAACLAPVLVVVAWWAAARIPPIRLGIARLNYLWLWPLGAFMTFGVVAGLWSALGAMARRGRVPALAAAVATAVLAAVPLLAHALTRVDPDTPVVFDRSAETAFSPFGFLVMTQLQASGIEFVANDATDGQRFRDRRVGAATADRFPHLYVVTGSNLERGRRWEP